MPTTLREIIEKNTQLNPAIFHEGEKGGYQAEQPGIHIKTTLRQLIEKNTQLNPAIFHEGEKTRTRRDIDNSYVNVEKDRLTIVRDGGRPTTCNYDKGPTYEQTLIALCEPIQINRNVYGNMSGQRPLQCMPTVYTRVKNTLPQTPFRFDTCPSVQLASNPYVSNLIQKSVTY